MIEPGYYDAVVRIVIKMLKFKAGVEMLSSGMELKMLKLKAGVWKISNLFFRGSVGLEGKMNDERMISQTLMVHKLGVLSTWCLADQLEIWERVSEEEWMCFLMLAGLSGC